MPFACFVARAVVNLYFSRQARPARVGNVSAWLRLRHGLTERSSYAGLVGIGANHVIRGMATWSACGFANLAHKLRSGQDRKMGFN